MHVEQCGNALEASGKAKNHEVGIDIDPDSVEITPAG